MKFQIGHSVLELLISLCLASLLLTMLIHLYLTSKWQYNQTVIQISQGMERQWLIELLTEHIRRSGFSPCLPIDELDLRDGQGRIVKGLANDDGLYINRMSDIFADVLAVISTRQIRVSALVGLQRGSPVLISNCEHGEIARIRGIKRVGLVYELTLENPLHFNYTLPTYIGAWLAEHWFIKTNAQGKHSIYYQINHPEELIANIQNMVVQVEQQRSKKMTKVALEFADERYELQVVTRNA